MRPRRSVWLMLPTLVFVTLFAASSAHAQSSNPASKLAQKIANLPNQAKKIGQLVRKAIDLSKKRLADLKELKALYVRIGDRDAITYFSKALGKQIVHFLEPITRDLVGDEKVTNDVPDFLKKAADWQKKQPGGDK